MKKTKYYYWSYMQQYEIGDDRLLTKDDLLEFYSKTGVKLHTEMHDDPWAPKKSGLQRQVGYTWEYVEEENLPKWFFLLKSYEVEIDQDTVELDQSESKSVNWQPNWKGLDYKRQVPMRKKK